MDVLTEQFHGFSSVFSNAVLGIGILCALAQCFFGFKLQKLWIAFIGFLIGFGIGAFGSLFFVPSEYAVTVAVIAGAVCGALAALAAYKLYRLGVFVLCAFNIFLAVSGFFRGPRMWIGILLGILLGLTAGFLTLKFLRPVIICSTAISGGLSVAASVGTMLHWNFPGPLFFIGLAVACGGIFVQFKTTKK